MGFSGSAPVKNTGFNAQGFRWEERPINATGEYKNFIILPNEFTAVQVEIAANYKSRPNNTICFLSFATVKDNIITDTKSILIKPPKNIYGHPYGQENTHEITPEMTKDAPYWGKVWKDISPYFKNQYIAAHYSYFAINSILAACAKLKDPFVFKAALDSCIAARRAFPEFENHKLETVCKNLNITIDPSNKAIACAEVLIKIGKTPLISPHHISEEDDYQCYFFNEPSKPYKVWEKTFNEKYGNDADDDWDDD